MGFSVMGLVGTIVAMVVVAAVCLSFLSFHKTPVALESSSTALEHETTELEPTTFDTETEQKTVEDVTNDDDEEEEEGKEGEERISGLHTFESIVTLNVGGHLFDASTSTLTRFPETQLGAMFSGRYKLTQDMDGAYFLDRDGTHFREILNFLRGSPASNQESISRALSPRALEELRVEADYYLLQDLMFPTPLFEPLKPVEVISDNGFTSTVLQSSDSLFIIQHNDLNIQGRKPYLVTVCDHCGVGYIRSIKHAF